MTKNSIPFSEVIEKINAASSESIVTKIDLYTLEDFDCDFISIDIDNIFLSKDFNVFFSCRVQLFKNDDGSLSCEEVLTESSNTYSMVSAVNKDIKFEHEGELYSNEDLLGEDFVTDILSNTKISEFKVDDINRILDNLLYSNRKKKKQTNTEYQR